MPCREVIDQTTYKMRTVLYSVDTNGENPQSVPIDLGAESDYLGINNLLQFPDGSLVIVAALYNQISAEVQSFRLIKKAPDGSTVFTVDPEPMFPGPGAGENNPESSFFINSAVLDGEGNIYLGSHMQGSSALICLSSDGKKLFDIPITGFLSDIAVDADGHVFVKYRYDVSGDIETEIRYIDVQKKALGNKFEIPFTGIGLINSNIFIGSGYDLYVKNDTGLYGVNLSETEPVLLVDWLDSDVAFGWVPSLIVIDSDKFVYKGQDQLTGRPQIVFLTRVPDDEVTQKFE